MADHPGARGRKALGAAFRLRHQPRRLLATGAAAAARAVRGLVLVDCLRRVAAALIGGVGLALVGRHAEKIRRGQDDARRSRLAVAGNPADRRIPPSAACR